MLLYTYVTDILKRRAPHRKAHLQRIEALRAADRLIVAGAFGDPPAGGVIGIRGLPREEVEAWADTDPYVTAGLVVERRSSPGSSRRQAVRATPRRVGVSSEAPWHSPRPACAGCERRTQLRGLVRETQLSASDFVYPLFVAEGIEGREPIWTMPGIDRLSVSEAVAEAGSAAALGIPAVILFGIPAEKDAEGSGA